MLTQEELFLKCPYATAQKILSGKWTLIILHHLDEDTVLRFSELHRYFPEITQATLTKQLRALEGYGMVKRTVYAQVPPKVEYELTDIGKEFSSILKNIETWGDKYIKEQTTV